MTLREVKYVQSLSAFVGEDVNEVSFSELFKASDSKNVSGGGGGILTSCAAC